MNIPPPPPPPSDSDDFIPPPPAPADSDSDSDLELMAASRTGALSSKLSSDSEDEHLPPPPNGASHLRSPGVLHNRRKSAMNIFDSEIQQSFADLEHRIHASKPSLPSMPSTPLSGLIGLGSVDHDLPPPPAASFQQKPLSPSSTTTQEASRMTSASVSVSSFNSPPSPMSTITTSTSLYSPPLTRATSASTAVQPTNANGAINPMLQRRGSDFRSRVGSLPTSLAGALSPGSQNGTLTKAKCLMPGCTAFGVRNQYCLRHVWRLSVEELEPLNQKQYQVAKEIVTTEKSYADGLRIVYKSFLLRINTMIEMEPNKPLLDAKDIQCIFHNIEDLYKLAENLYSDLEEITLEKVLTSQIGTTLLHYAPQFRIYQTYLENYDDAIKQLHTIRKEKPEFDFFCKLQEKCEGLSLESFLIMPVQRLPRYLLLLAELIKRSESASFSDSALADINSAKERISNIANSINASLHQKENQLKVLAIQNQFERDSRYQDLVTPTRYLIKEGALKKRYGKGSRHLSSSTVYYFFLFSDILVYADFSKNVLGKGVTYKLKHILPLNDMAVEPTSSAKGKNKDISVSTKSGAGDSKNFDLSCADTADRDVWLKAIQDAINRIAEDSKELKTTSFDGTSSKEKAGKSSKLKAMMGV